jgi:hypothetical protein
MFTKYYTNYQIKEAKMDGECIMREWEDNIKTDLIKDMWPCELDSSGLE